MKNPALAAAALALLVCCTSPAMALSYCASDGLRAPVVLVERFFSADCTTCWAAPPAKALPRGALALDWVLPAAQGDDAPMSTIATRDAQQRLEALGRSALSRATLQVSSAVRPAAGLRLRVAHGLPVNDYVGTSIEAKPAAALQKHGEFTAWLALVETIPAGVEDSPVERNVVRNLLVPAWTGASTLSRTEQKRFYDSRPMYVAQGAKPARLRVVGWLQDGQGRVIAAAQSKCQ